MQHGEALPEEKDPQRSLTEEGKKQVERSAKALKRLGLKVDLILTSSKKRAQQTAEIVARELDYPADKIEKTEKLDPTAPISGVLSLLKSAGKERVFIAGHLPSLAEIASSLLSEKKASIRFQNGGILRIDTLESR